MRPFLLAAALLAGCTTFAGEPSPSLGFALAAIDGRSLPTFPITSTPSERYDRASLDFGPIVRLGDGDQGVVVYEAVIGGQANITRHHYVVASGMIHIDLCPIGFACVAVIGMELVGPVEPTRLVLTRSFGATGMPSSVFRFEMLARN